VLIGGRFAGAIIGQFVNIKCFVRSIQLKNNWCLIFEMNIDRVSKEAGAAARIGHDLRHLFNMASSFPPFFAEMMVLDNHSVLLLIEENG